MSETETTIWQKVTENNEWEGETWYHYFQDDNTGKILTALQAAVQHSGGELEGPETVELTWDQTKVLTNLDDGDYMQCHWFGKLTDLDGLSKAREEELYKGGIRAYGEELFIQGEGQKEEE